MNLLLVVVILVIALHGILSSSIAMVVDQSTQSAAPSSPASSFLAEKSDQLEQAREAVDRRLDGCTDNCVVNAVGSLSTTPRAHERAHFHTKGFL